MTPRGACAARQPGDTILSRPPRGPGRRAPRRGWRSVNWSRPYGSRGWSGVRGCASPIVAGPGAKPSLPQRPASQLIHVRWTQAIRKVVAEGVVADRRDGRSPRGLRCVRVRSFHDFWKRRDLHPRPRWPSRRYPRASPPFRSFPGWRSPLVRRFASRPGFPRRSALLRFPTLGRASGRGECRSLGGTGHRHRSAEVALDDIHVVGMCCVRSDVTEPSDQLRRAISVRSHRVEI